MYKSVCVCVCVGVCVGVWVWGCVWVCVWVCVCGQVIYDIALIKLVNLSKAKLNSILFQQQSGSDWDIDMARDVVVKMRNMLTSFFNENLIKRSNQVA